MERRRRRDKKSGGANRSRGFTLIEVLVTTALVAIALAGVMGGIRSLTAADIKARDADLLQRLASQKMSELGSITDPNTADEKGDFTEQGHPDVTWAITVEASGVENVDQVTVTATRGNAEQSLTGLIFVRPASTAGAGGGTGGGT